jgi:hypothetical protein
MVIADEATVRLVNERARSKWQCTEDDLREALGIEGDLPTVSEAKDRRTKRNEQRREEARSRA